MFKLCKYSGSAAVCTNINEREVFKSILKTIYPETYVCEHAAYAIKSFLNAEFIIYSLEFIKNKASKGYYVRDFYTDNVIFLNKDNLRVVCTKQGRCDKTPIVVEYSKKGS